MQSVYDCVIVGGGAVGATLALMLAQLKHSVLLIEKEPSSTNVLAKEALHLRTIALSQASTYIYQALQIFEMLKEASTPIKQVRVSMKGQYGTSCLTAPNNAPLGRVIGLTALESALYQTLSKLDNIQVLRPAVLQEKNHVATGWELTVHAAGVVHQVKCGLLVAADGIKSSLREAQKIACHTKEYGHYGIMANVKIADSEPLTATERFLPDGAIALLPWRDNISTLVWSGNAEIQSVLSLSDADFLRVCQAQLGRRVGKLTAVGKRTGFPLQMHLAAQQVSTRFLLLGNAAHSLHPIAAQGLNLSLRDIWQLRSQVIKAQHGLGSDAFLSEYEHARQIDQNNMIFATDKIARLMAGGPIAPPLRALGITLFDTLSPLKSLFTRLGMGL